MKIWYAMGSKYNKDIGYEAKIFEENPFITDIDHNLSVSGVDLSDEARSELLGLLRYRLHTFKTEIVRSKNDIFEHNESFPAESVFPLALINQLTQYSESVDFGSKFVDFGFTYEKLNLLTEKQKKSQKSIEKSEWTKEKNEKGHEAVFQLMADTNLFNTALNIFTSQDKSWSVRKLMEQNEKTDALEMFTTSTLGQVLPSFTEQYGEGKNLDIKINPSFQYFKSGVPNAKSSNVQIDKNGNWKI